MKTTEEELKLNKEQIGKIANSTNINNFMDGFQEGQQKAHDDEVEFLKSLNFGGGDFTERRNYSKVQERIKTLEKK